MINDHIILVIFWLLYCSAHSILAATSVKQWFHKVMGKTFIYYRLLYTLFSFAALIGLLWYQISLFSPLLFDNSGAFKIIGGLMLLAGGSIMLYCIRKYFMSLSGLRSLVRSGETSNMLIINGMHRYVRHPLYLGTFIFIWGLWLVVPLLSLLIADIIITFYTLVGITFEEKKLEAEFGDRYRAYKRQVPKILPFK